MLVACDQKSASEATIHFRPQNVNCEYLLRINTSKHRGENIGNLVH